MAEPSWGYFLATIVGTRAYESGLEACLRLLTFSENHHDSLTEEEYEDHLIQLYLAILEMLDRLDRWEEYALVWDGLRANTRLAFTQPQRPASLGMGPFILTDEGNLIHVHFLWFTAHRRRIIGRKLDKLHSGRKLGNLLHSQQDELSDAEIRTRWERIKERILFAKMMNDLDARARAR
ncbi:MAG: hypothetical protein WA871_10340 [Candidatus Acidiferrales bacterium]